MSWSITAPGVKTQDKPLKDGAHDQLLGSTDVGGDFEFPLAGGTAKLAASIQAQVELYNDDKDHDDGGVIGKPPAKAGASSQPSPLFVPGDTGCWLKYATRVSAKASVGGEFPFVSLDANGTVNVLVADYRWHDPAQTLATALRQDVQTLRLPFLLADVKALGPRDALSLQATLTLETGLTLSWSDLSTSVISAFARETGTNQLLALQSTVGASVSGKVSLTDEFRLVFSRRTDSGPFTLSVLKSTAQGTSVSFALEAKAELGSPALENLLEAVADSEQTAAAVNRLVEGLENNALAQELLPLAQQLLGRLGLQTDLSSAAITAAYSKARDILETAVNQKLQAAFQYEYARVTAEATLLELEVPADQMDQVHPTLVSGNIVKIQQLTQDAWIRRFLHQQSTTLSQAWGFTLGWRDFTFLDAQDRKRLEAVVQYASRDTLQGPRRCTYLGVRSYEHAGWLAGHDVHYSVDFKADMKDFSSNPSADEFQYGLYGQFRAKGKLSLEALQQAIDQAVVWRALPEASSADVLQRIQAAAAGGKTIATRLELRLDPPQQRALLATLGADPTSERRAFARALARATPWASQPVRSTPGRRQELYEPLWLAFLQDEGRDWSLRRVPGIVADYLKRNAGADGFVAANWELSKGADGHASPGTFMDVLEKNSVNGGNLGDTPYAKIFNDWSELKAKLAALQQAIQAEAALPSNPEQSVIAAAFAPLEEAAGNAFRFTALGAWLLELSASQGMLADVSRTFTVTVGEEGSQLALTFASA